MGGLWAWALGAWGNAVMLDEGVNPEAAGADKGVIEELGASLVFIGARNLSTFSELGAGTAGACGVGWLTSCGGIGADPILFRMRAISSGTGAFGNDSPESS